MKRFVLMSVALLAMGASAQSISVQEVSVKPSGGQGWSVHSGQTVGAKQTVIVGEMGWPGLSVSLLRGATSRVDIGGRFTFNYGVEGMVTEPLATGLKFQGLLRVSLAESSRFNLGLHFAPGPFFYSYGRYTWAGLSLPVGFVLGIPVGSAVMLNLGMDFPIWVRFGPGGGMTFPILVGGGAEYFLDRRLSVSFNARMGPSVIANYYAPFTLQAQIGVGYQL